MSESGQRDYHRSIHLRSTLPDALYGGKRLGHCNSFLLACLRSAARIMPRASPVTRHVIYGSSLLQGALARNLRGVRWRFFEAMDRSLPPRGFMPYASRVHRYIDVPCGNQRLDYTAFRTPRLRLDTYGL